MSSPPNPIFSLGMSRGPSARPAAGAGGAAIDGNPPEGAPFISAPMLGTVVPVLASSGLGAIVLGGGICTLVDGGWLISWGLRAIDGMPLLCGI